MIFKLSTIKLYQNSLTLYEHANLHQNKNHYYFCFYYSEAAKK